MDFLSVFLNKEDNSPLYYQLYNNLVGQIRSGGLAAGNKLPGKRTAAAQLGVSVNTVDEAYQMLAAEGYVDAVPRSGFVVCRLEQQLPPPAAASAAPGGGQQAGTPWRHSFASGDLDDSLFPKKTWNRLQREVLAEEDGLFGRGEGMGDAVLRRAIAGYLQGYRGVRCHQDQIAVGAGLEVLTGRLARLLGAGPYALEDPGYPKVAHILRNNGYQTLPVAVDESGMRPDLLAQSGARVAYLTPSHQYPTGGVMRMARRTELLRWAARGGHVIIEDDYDSEFRFDGRPLPCLQGLDEGGHVVYAGTFSRSLAAGLRAAYLVLPPALLAAWLATYGDYACTVSRPEQHTLARLMDEGHFARGINRVRGVYHKRRNALLAALAEELGGMPWCAENTHTGLYLVLRLPGKAATEIAARARQSGLRLRALDEYRAAAPTNKKTADALVLGYGGLRDDEIAPAVGALAKLVV